VRLDARATLTVVATTVGAALARHGIRAVLTGGACASLYTCGRYQSRDIDFIVSGPITQTALDRALASIEFVRRGDRYVHGRVPFYVEFPKGPLAIGGDHRITPVQRRSKSGPFLTLSATDSCRDRLAAFYHWNDRESLAVAAQIARARRIDLAAIGQWSVGEGFPGPFEEFLARVRQGRRRQERRARPGPTRGGASPARRARRSAGP
jgi:hypothetical protein